jgi:hypothetical protein
MGCLATLGQKMTGRELIGLEREVLKSMFFVRTRNYSLASFAIKLFFSLAALAVKLFSSFVSFASLAVKLYVRLAVKLCARYAAKA